MRPIYIISRAIYYSIIWLIGITIDFVLPRLIPSNIIATLVYESVSSISYGAQSQNIFTTNLETLAEELGLAQYYHQPLYIQYFDFLHDIFHLNFGPSLSEYPIPVSQIILEAAPWTFLIVIPAVVSAFFIGNILGRYAALNRGTLRDYAILASTMFMYTFPVFVVGEILIEFLAVDLRLFPIGGAYNVLLFHKPTLTFSFIISVLYHAILPVFTLIIVSLAGWTMGMRNNMIPILQEDFMNYYRLMGVPEKIVASRSYKVAILPNFTGFAIAMGYTVLGAVAIEYLFNYAGLGYFFNQAILSMDYPLLNGIFFMLVTALVISNFVAEILYGVIDPRTSHEETEGV